MRRRENLEDVCAILERLRIKLALEMMFDDKIGVLDGRIDKGDVHALERINKHLSNFWGILKRMCDKYEERAGRTVKEEA